ncbi:SDR family NAD(P)-dependent oxidoreductase [Halosquirtibacter xylanolyticus]|uniref:SDR family NAD(P)-dependent oxidoreductase n=1 Tax=Halosquirtibacter xylanolyticus TaxID=3374599 RepID=UPI003748DA03|nr:SDR family NAD(P)-dependent oxidoreductase [Prolixibacteraceae bacterium]
MHKLALVTGSSRRIGREISLKLASIGYSLILHYSNDYNGVESLKKELEESYSNLQFFSFQGDLRCPTFVDELSQFCDSKCVIVNLLIHNASIFEPDDLTNVSFNSLQDHFSIHLFQPLLITKWFSKQAVKGQVVTIVDQAVTNKQSAYLSYILSKKSLLEATYMLSLAMAPGFRVNAILPGMILPSKHGNAEKFHKEVLETPLKIAPGVQSILSALVFLIDNEWATGQTIYCDGGEHLV